MVGYPAEGWHDGGAWKKFGLTNGCGLRGCSRPDRWRRTLARAGTFKSTVKPSNPVRTCRLVTALMRSHRGAQGTWRWWLWPTSGVRRKWPFRCTSTTRRRRRPPVICPVIRRLIGAVGKDAKGPDRPSAIGAGLPQTTVGDRVDLGGISHLSCGQCGGLVGLNPSGDEPRSQFAHQGAKLETMARKPGH